MSPSRKAVDLPPDSSPVVKVDGRAQGLLRAATHRKLGSQDVGSVLATVVEDPLQVLLFSAFLRCRFATQPENHTLALTCGLDVQPSSALPHVMRTLLCSSPVRTSCCWAASQKASPVRAWAGVKVIVVAHE